ncbi:MAG: hypothetical protein ACOH1V_09530 [Stenotrophomonas sp.]
MTATLAPPESMLGARTYQYYQLLGANPLFLDDSRLDLVPVAGWEVEADPEQPLPKGTHTFDGGNVAHAGFLVWNGDHFESRVTLPAALGLCPSDVPLRCLTDDRFVRAR